jgi:hypothetical protein
MVFSLNFVVVCTNSGARQWLDPAIGPSHPSLGESTAVVEIKPDLAPAG